MVKAPQPAILGTPIAEIHPSVRAMKPQQAYASLIVPEHHQIFAEQTQRDGWPAGWQFLAQGSRLPVPPQQLAARRSRARLCE